MESIDMVKVKSSIPHMVKASCSQPNTKKMILSVKKEAISIQIFKDIDLDQLSILLKAVLNDGR